MQVTANVFRPMGAMGKAVFDLRHAWPRDGDDIGSVHGEVAENVCEPISAELPDARWHLNMAAMQAVDDLLRRCRRGFFRSTHGARAADAKGRGVSDCGINFSQKKCKNVRFNAMD